jgi:hypothetical protein
MSKIFLERSFPNEDYIVWGAVYLLIKSKEKGLDKVRIVFDELPY